MCGPSRFAGSLDRRISLGSILQYGKSDLRYVIKRRADHGTVLESAYSTLACGRRQPDSIVLKVKGCTHVVDVVDWALVGIAVSSK